jgi:hypothetical protein
MAKKAQESRTDALQVYGANVPQGNPMVALDGANS